MTDAPPEGWATALLPDLVYFAGRIGWRGLKADEYTKSGAILLSVHNLNNGRDVDYSRLNYVSRARYEESPEIQVRVNDVLLTKDGAGIGKSGFVANLPGEATVNSSLLLLRSLGALKPRFLFYSVIGPRMQRLVQERITGSTTPHLFQKDVKQFELLVPPLAEQERIVAKVEAALARTNAARQRLAKVPAILKRFRQSVLAAACSGRLTADWRAHSEESGSVDTFAGKSIPGIESSNEERERASSVSKEANTEDHAVEIPVTWAWRQLGQLVHNHDSKRVPVKQEDRAKRRGCYPYYGAFGIIDEIDAFLFQGDFLLVAEDGKNLESRLRPIALLASGKFWVNNHAHVLQPRAGISLGYLEAYLNSSTLHLAPFLAGAQE